ncbi:MAG: hypothetical protein K2W96_10025 [Gemmataceae bacterium]|nr:hypothetical protein [Gemmataceae bacterium]
MSPRRQALLDQSVALFRRDLDDLMRTHKDQWVAYHGDRLLGFSPNKLNLLQRCYADGFTDEDLYLIKVEPPCDEMRAGSGGLPIDPITVEAGAP